MAQWPFSLNGFGRQTLKNELFSKVFFLQLPKHIQKTLVHMNYLYSRPPKKNMYSPLLLEITILKIGLRHVLSWPKIGIEPKFHDAGTFGGFGKCEQTNKIHVL